MLGFQPWSKSVRETSCRLCFSIAISIPIPIGDLNVQETRNLKSGTINIY